MMKLKIGTKIVAGFIIVLVLMVMVGYFGVSKMKEVQADYADMITNDLSAAALLNDFEYEIAQREANLQAYLRTGNLKKAEIIKEHHQASEKIRENLIKIIDQDEEKQLLAKTEELDAKYNETVSRIIELHKSGLKAEALRKLPETDKIIGELLLVINDWQEFLNKENADSIREIEGDAASGRMVAIVVTIAAVLTGIGIATFIGRTTSKSVNLLTKIAQEVAAGDISHTVPEIKTGDEIQVLGNAFKVMVENLRRLIQAINDSAFHVASTSQQLRANSDEAAKATQQVANAIEEVAKGASEQTTFVTNTMETVSQVNNAIYQISAGAQEQANNVTLTADMVSEMASSIQEVASGARTVSASAERTREAADEGENAVNLTIKGMEGIKTKVFETANKIRELGEHSQQIGEIIQVIDDIAEQTNLLALNAAIEAARAGEHGKGFAVVADEVRKLAERSGKATKEIADLITNVQKLTAGAVTAMEKGTGEVEQGAGLALDAGKALKEILGNVEETYRQVQSISAAAEQISAGSREVVKAIDNVSAITQENTAATEELTAASTQVATAMGNISAVTQESSAAAEEVSASTEEMTASVQEISAASEQLAKMAEDLQQLVAQFKL